ncbi:MAG: FkbM family methyltransferase [Pseudomonadota bacterium]
MWKVLCHLLHHPLNRANRIGALSRFVRWQISSRIMSVPHIVPFVNGTVLVMDRGMTGATGNWYSGLHEHREMAFVLHMLRSDDLFADVGANVGSYTVLAAGAAGARVVSFEPLPDTFGKLRRNVLLNGLEPRVASHNIGVGAENGVLRFTSDGDTKNHVIIGNGLQGGSSVDVTVRRLDDILAGETPRVIKIDVEGWEAEVLRGMSGLIADPRLAAIIMETNDSADRYCGEGQQSGVQRLLEAGFRIFTYDPFARQLSKSNLNAHNTIFVRDLKVVKERLATAEWFTLVNTQI